MKRLIFLGVSACIVLAVALVYVWSAQRVVDRAQDIAQGEPYCIQVARADTDYGPALRLLDLSALTMWAKRDSGLYMQHHAVLVVGDGGTPRLFHWSYRLGDFQPGVLNGSRAGHEVGITCAPDRSFAERLPLWSAEDPQRHYVRLSTTEAFAFPASYQPRWSGGGSKNVFILAPAPSFEPVAARWRQMSGTERDQNWIHVDWNPRWLLSLMESDRQRSTDSELTQHGLQKLTTRYVAKDGSVHRSEAYHAQADDGDHQVTHIACGRATPANPRACQHRFLHEGRHFYFRHRPEDLPDWRALQKRVIDLFASFAA